MKELLVLMVAVFALLGCSGDDDEKGVNEVVGKWVQTYYRNSSTNSFIGQEDGTYFLFGSDGTFTFFYSGWGSFNETTTGKYRVTGSASLPAFLELEYGDGEKAKVDILSPDANGDATFVIDGLYTGTYKFRKK